jgi:hypothetical protein
MRFYLVWVSVGALAGVIVATLVAPSVLTNVLAFTGAQDAMCQCTELVARTTSTFIKVQLWGAGIGGVGVPVCAYLVRRFFTKRGELEPGGTPTPQH